MVSSSEWISEHDGIILCDFGSLEYRENCTITGSLCSHAAHDVPMDYDVTLESAAGAGCLLLWWGELYIDSYMYISMG